jgi:iron(III) transport system substrate-binding protein
MSCLVSLRPRIVASMLFAAASTLSSAAHAEEIVVYEALDFVSSAAKAFTVKTGIDVKVVELESTGEVLGKVAAEGDHPKFDVLWLEGSAILDRLGQGGYLMALPGFSKSVAYTDLGQKLVPASSFYFPTNVSTTAIAVNTKKVSGEETPTSWADLAKPAFKDAVGAKDPNLSGPAYQWLAGLFQTVGEEKGKALLKTILTNKKLSGLPTGGSLSKQLLTGNAKVGIAQDSATFAKAAGGEPLVEVYPTEGVVATPSSIAISAKSAHADAARKFLQFVLSEQGQAAMLDGDDADFFFVPVVKGVVAKPGRKTDINFIILDDKIAVAHEAEWKKWFRDNFVQ